MYRRSRGHGPLFYAVLLVVGLGAAIAVCRAFDFDPFGIIGWVIDSTAWLVGRIADVIYDSGVFRQMVGR